MIQEHLAAGAAGWHDRQFPIGFVGLRMTHGHDGVDLAVSLKQRSTERHRLGADRKPPHRRPEVQSGPDAPIEPTDASRNSVPKWPVMPRQHIMRRGDQCMISLR